VTKHQSGPQPRERHFHRVRISCYSRSPASHDACRRDRGERALPQGGAPEVGLSLNEVFVPLNARA
jgi:hypothetical protein